MDGHKGPRYMYEELFEGGMKQGESWGLPRVVGPPSRGLFRPLCLLIGISLIRSHFPSGLVSKICVVVVAYLGLDLASRCLTKMPLSLLAHLLFYKASPRKYFGLLGLLSRFSIVQNYMHDTYHGKPVTTEDAKKIVMIERDLPRVDLGERILPYKEVREMALSANSTVGVIECTCRMLARERNHGQRGKCGPSAVCMVFGLSEAMCKEKGGRLLTKQEALDLLDDQHRLGHVHNVYFKNVFDGFFAICNCCKCCCGGIATMMAFGRSLTSSGYVAQVDNNKCCGCGACVKTCPFDAIEMKDRRPVFDPRRCLGCTACDGTCPKKAISYLRDPSKPEPLDINAIANNLCW
ncbi:4Fe-4S ferredoxin [Pelomyxa schiedti]|nr:4Fe-4S ferredoxin [Pelomyxa schiedti]